MSDPEAIQSNNDTVLSPLNQALTELWDRSRKAVEIINALREEVRRLTEEKDQLERRLAQSAASPVSEAVKPRETLPTPFTTGSGELVIHLTAEERDRLERQIDELLARIEMHLS